jgi:hypothetical protein
MLQHVARNRVQHVATRLNTPPLAAWADRRRLCAAAAAYSRLRLAGQRQAIAHAADAHALGSIGWHEAHALVRSGKGGYGLG